ncbi:hypothetical protein NJ7G_1245 [Natrinema sp. J7-2]|nr:hypothetical protein NJ7G_1245 [Natrinema sp. J7-2]
MIGTHAVRLFLVQCYHTTIARRRSTAAYSQDRPSLRWITVSSTPL